MNLIRLSFVAITLIVASLSGAAPVNFAGKTQPIKVGTLVVDRVGEPSNSAPHTWSQLDKDRSIKPAGWSLVNPRAQTVVTDTIQNRWTVLTGAAPAIGTRLTKREAPYWEVRLSTTSLEVLAEYDALLLPVDGFISISPIQREKLRRFVDQGGLLWVDFHKSFGVSVDTVNCLPLPLELTSVSSVLYADTANPLVSRPNKLSINELGALYGGGGLVGQEITTVGPTTNIQSWLIGDSLKWNSVVGTATNQFTAGVARLGDGYILATTRGVSSVLNQGLTQTGTVTVNTGYRSELFYRTNAWDAAAKLIINGLSLASEYSAEGRGTRKTNATGVNLTAPLYKNFVRPGRPSSTPTFYNGKMLISEGGRVTCIDISSRDIDGDGNQDDGLQDAFSQTYDVLWQSAVVGGGGMSAPTVTQLPRAVAADFDQDVVLVQDSTGRVSMFPMDPTASLNAVPAINQWSVPNISRTGISNFPAAPVVHEGIAFISDTGNNDGLGRIWCIDLARNSIMRSTNDFVISSANRLGPVSGSPTIGYIPILDNSGGVDKVVYLPFKGDPQRQAGFVSLWFGTRGESPVQVTASGSVLSVVTRAATQNLPIYLPGGVGNPSLGVKVSVIDPVTGVPFNTALTESFFTGNITAGGSNGSLNIELSATGQGRVWNGPGQDASLRIDYTLDWGAPTFGANGATKDSFIRGDLQLPDDTGSARQIMGNIAMAANGNLFVVTSNPDELGLGGSFFCIKENGRGDFRVLYRWEAFDEFQYNTLGGSTSFNYDGSTIDYDGLLSFPGIGGFLNRKPGNVRFVGGPVVHGDTAYCAVSFGKPFGPGDRSRWVTSVMAFDTDPLPLECTVAGLTSGNFAMLQPDIARSAIKTAPTTTTILQPGNFIYEAVNGNGRVSLQNSAVSSRGKIRDCIAFNIPFAIRRQGSPDIIVEPELDSNNIVLGPGQTSPMVAGNAQGRWNPMKWQMVLNGFTMSNNFENSQMFMGGDTLYMGGGSFLPSLLRGVPNFTTTDGFIYALDTRVAGTDIRSPIAKQSWMSPNTVARTWQKYISLVDIGPIDPDEGVPTVIPSPYMVWPTTTGIRTISDLEIRVRQATITDPKVVAISGGDRGIAAWSPSNTFYFTKGDFIVADEARIVRVDSTGGPIWSSEGSASGGDPESAGGSASFAKFSNPTRVYATGLSTYIVADPGSNRIAEVDSSGKEIRTITGFKVDPSYIPTGVQDNTNTKLSMPSDVVTFTTYEDISTIPVSQRPAPATNNPFATGPNEYWIHYVIADTGNNRVIEIVDRYVYDARNRRIGEAVKYFDVNSQTPTIERQGFGILRWQIKGELLKKKYAYNSIDRVYFTDGLGTRPIYVFGFGNIQASGSSFGLDTPTTVSQDNPMGSGGVVLYDPVSGKHKVVEQFSMPAIPAGALWNDATGSFASAARPATTRKIQGLKSATVRWIAGGVGDQLAVMITDNTGVYELIEQPAVGATPAFWSMRWFLPNEAYEVMRRSRASGWPTAKNPEKLEASYARRLSSGEVIVVNKHVGRQRTKSPISFSPTFGLQPGDPFSGEVLLINGDFAGGGRPGFSLTAPNLGFDGFSINFELPPLAGTRPLTAPRFADKRF